MSLATLFWQLLRHRLAPALRADAGFMVIAGAFGLNSILALAIYIGVVNDIIIMTTMSFHQLMNGPYGVGITILSMVLLAASMTIGYEKWRKGYVPPPDRSQNKPVTINGIAVFRNPAVPTICLVGVWNPQIWVNPGYWDDLDNEEREIAVFHELVHLKRRDNLKRLLIMFIDCFFSVLPWMRRWVAQYELDSELAVDDHCREHRPVGKYLSLVAGATEFVLAWDNRPIASHLSHADHASRLKVLANPRVIQSKRLSAGIGVAIALLSILPGSGLLLHPLSRCLLACYLGY